MDLPVQFEQSGHRGAFFIARDGERAAELTFSASGDGKLVMLDHTEVSESLKGQGAGRTLVEEAVKWARREGIRLFPVCPFAKAIFAREPSFHDVLV
jgi:predicted GNAT family acetyltransferase